MCPCRFGKISRSVSFGEDLDISEFADGGAESGDRDWSYRLCGVVVHHDVGGSTNYGHYIAFVRRGTNWFCLDDDEWASATWEQVAGQKAYMLFYQASSKSQVVSGK